MKEELRDEESVWAVALEEDTGKIANTRSATMSIRCGKCQGSMSLLEN